MEKDDMINWKNHDNIIRNETLGEIAEGMTG
jgi:hypothetical protein